MAERPWLDLPRKTSRVLFRQETSLVLFEVLFKQRPWPCWIWLDVLDLVQTTSLVMFRQRQWHCSDNVLGLDQAMSMALFGWRPSNLAENILLLVKTLSSDWFRHCSKTKCLSKFGIGDGSSDLVLPPVSRFGATPVRPPVLRNYSPK